MIRYVWIQGLFKIVIVFDVLNPEERLQGFQNLLDMSPLVATNSGMELLVYLLQALLDAMVVPIPRSQRLDGMVYRVQA